MKIRINKKQLLDGVKFDYSINANKPLRYMKIRFYYMEDTQVFVLIDYNAMKLHIVEDYSKFRKKLNEIIEDW